jgi:hypothetical protein
MFTGIVDPEPISVVGIVPDDFEVWPKGFKELHALHFGLDDVSG